MNSQEAFSEAGAARPGRTPPQALELIRRLGSTTTDETLAAQLNAAGLRTGKGKPFTPAAVHRVRETYQIRAPRTVPLREGEITVPDAAHRLGVPDDRCQSS